MHLLEQDIARLREFDPTIARFEPNLDEFRCDKGMKLVHNRPAGDLALVWKDLQGSESRMYKLTSSDYDPNLEGAMTGPERWIRIANEDGIEPGELEDVLNRTFKSRGSLPPREALELIASRNYVWLKRKCNRLELVHVRLGQADSPSSPVLIAWGRISKRCKEIATPGMIEMAAGKIITLARTKATAVEAKLNGCRFGSKLQCKLVTCCRSIQAAFESW